MKPLEGCHKHTNVDIYYMVSLNYVYKYGVKRLWFDWKIDGNRDLLIY